MEYVVKETEILPAQPAVVKHGNAFRHTPGLALLRQAQDPSATEVT